MIKYRTSNGVISALKIEEECPNTVTILNGSTERKKAPLINWHDTWDEAKDFLLASALLEVTAARLAVMRANTRVERIRKLVMP